MIDNLISDKMKEIWINLELYFESYEISNFKGFFGSFSDFYEFIWIYFEFKRMKIIRFYPVLM